jgi:hypothetical protein
MHGWFGIFHFDLPAAIGGLQDKTPISGVFEAAFSL